MRRILLVVLALTAASCTTSTREVDKVVSSPSPSPSPVASPSPVKVSAVTVRVPSPSPVAVAAAGNGQRTAEDCGALHYSTDGNPFPVLCPDGAANVHAVDLWRSHNDLTIELGPDANQVVVHEALCLDLREREGSNPISDSLYKTAAAMNRWSFGIDITDNGLVGQTCT